MSVDSTTKPGSPKTVAQMLGEMVWLMTQSPLHKQMFISDLEWFCLPAIALEQYRVFYGPNTPVAVAFWASISEEADERLTSGGLRLRPDEWNGGEIPWLIELVAPFGGQDEIMRDLAVSLFDGRPYKFHAIDPDGTRRVHVSTDQPAFDPVN